MQLMLVWSLQQRGPVGDTGPPGSALPPDPQPRQPRHEVAVTGAEPPPRNDQGQLPPRSGAGETVPREIGADILRGRGRGRAGGCADTPGYTDSGGRGCRFYADHGCDTTALTALAAWCSPVSSPGDGAGVAVCPQPAELRAARRSCCRSCAGERGPGPGPAPAVPRSSTAVETMPTTREGLEGTGAPTVGLADAADTAGGLGAGGLGATPRTGVEAPGAGAGAGGPGLTCSAQPKTPDEVAMDSLSGCSMVFREFLLRTIRTKSSAAILRVPDRALSAGGDAAADGERGCSLARYAEAQGHRVVQPTSSLPGLLGQADSLQQLSWTLLAVIDDSRFEEALDGTGGANLGALKRLISRHTVTYIVVKVQGYGASTIALLARGGYRMQVLECNRLLDHRGWGPNSPIEAGDAEQFVRQLRHCFWGHLSHLYQRTHAM